MSRGRSSARALPSAWLLAAAGVFGVAFAGDRWGRQGGWIAASILAAGLVGMAYGAWVGIVHAGHLVNADQAADSGKTDGITQGLEQPLAAPAPERSEADQSDDTPRRDGANLSGATLAGADLRGAHLRGADLTNADLRGADLSRADLTDAVLRDARLGSTISRGVERGAPWPSQWMKRIRTRLHPSDS
jgi:hypothetical protein